MAPDGSTVGYSIDFRTSMGGSMTAMRGWFTAFFSPASLHPK